MQRILVATDGSEHASRAVVHAATLAARFEADLLIVQVVPHAALDPGERALIEAEYAQELRERLPRPEPRLGPGAAPASFLERGDEGSETIRALLGERILDSAEDRAREAGATRVRRLLTHGDPARSILAVAEREGADAIVVGSRGLGELRALLVGSVSHKIAQLAQTTVVVVR